MKQLWTNGYETIHILHQHIFRLFLTHPPYFDINSMKHSQKKLPFFWPHPPSPFTWYRDGPKNTVFLEGPYDIKKEKKNIVLVLKLLWQFYSDFQ